MIFRPSRRRISGTQRVGEGVEQFVLFRLGHGAEVEDDAVAEYAGDDRGRVLTKTFVERVGREGSVREGDERGRRVRGRGGAAADGRLAVDDLEVENALV